MGTLKTTNIQSISGSGTVTLGTSGDTITIPSGASTSGVGQIKKITVNEGITTQYATLGPGDTTLTDIKVIHTALSTSNKLGFYISIPYTYYTNTNVGITNFKINDGGSDIKTGLFYNFTGARAASELSLNAMAFDITPGSTSAVTYTCKATIYRPSGSSTVTIGDSNYPSKVICVEYGANV